MRSGGGRSGVPPGTGSRLVRVATFKPAYLIHGDDHGRISERRARLRAIAEAESGTGGVELFEGDAATPEAVSLALNAMTFAMGRRFLIVEGVERWKDADVEATLAPALAGIAPDTTVAFFGREEGRAKIPAKLEAAVKKAGGDVVAETMLKARELPRWAVSEAERLGVRLEGAAAQALVAQVGERQQRLLRELEKLALEHGEGARIGVEEIEGAAAMSAERQVWGLVDALVARDRRQATRAFLELRAQGEALPRLIPLIARRVRDVLAIAGRLEAGESPAQVKSSLKGSPWAADRRIKEARATDADALRRALEALAELELASRGLSELSEDTAALRAIDAIAA
jgi:DNA polymerase-3 subunit delta